MAAEDNNLQSDFIEPEEDFLADTQFPPAEDEDVFQKRGPLGRRLGRRKKVKDFTRMEESGETELASPDTNAGGESRLSTMASLSSEPVVDVKAVKFPDLEKSLPGGGLLTSEMFDHIPVQVKVILGSAEVSLKEILDLSENSIITLEKLIGDSLDLVINEQVIAQGEVVVVDGNYGIKITKIIRKK